MALTHGMIRFQDYPVIAVTTVTATVKLALAANPGRIQLAIQNRTGEDVYYKIGLTAPTDSDDMFLLATGQMLLMAAEGVCTGTVWLLQSSGGDLDVHVGEGG